MYNIKQPLHVPLIALLSAMVAQPTEHRLPTNVQPVHYDLAFCTDLEAQTFRGLAIIRCATRRSWPSACTNCF
jgi:hypothetical protein